MIANKSTLKKITSIMGISIFWCLVFIGLMHTPRIRQCLSTKKSISIFTWPMLIDPEYVQKFEQKTGIRVNISYYETNEELLSKLEATKGIGYDLIIPSDYAVSMLIKKGLLQPIEKDALSCWKTINPAMQDLYCDPGNKFTIPYFGAVYGLGINTHMYSCEDNIGWEAIFDERKIQAPIGMLDAAREAISLTYLYLYGNPPIDSINKEASAAIKKLLEHQKKWVAAYTESNAEHILLSGTAPIVVALSPDIYRLQKTYPYIDFRVPREGSFMVIDSFAIPAFSKKKTLVYQFIEYIYDQKVIEHHQKKYGMLSPLITATQTQVPGVYQAQKDHQHFHFFKTTIPEPILHNIWIDVMAQ